MDELRVLGNRRVQLAVVITVVAMAAVFTAYTFLAPLLTDVAGFDKSTVTWLMLVFGIGSLLGNLLGGRLADRALMPALTGILAVLAAALVALAVAAPTRWACVALMFVFGVAYFAVMPGLQARILTSVAGGAPTLAVSVNISAFNIGIAGGAWFGGGLLDLDLGLRVVVARAPHWRAWRRWWPWASWSGTGGRGRGRSRWPKRGKRWPRKPRTTTYTSSTSTATRYSRLTTRRGAPHHEYEHEQDDASPPPPAHRRGGGATAALTVPGVGAAVARDGRGTANPADFGAVTVGPDDPRYPELTHGTNQRWVGRPDHIRLVSSAEQVVAAVQRAVRDGKRIAVRSGGHCYEDFVNNSEVQVVIDMSEMAEITYDAGRRAFAVEPGAMLSEVYDKLYKVWGVTIPGGSCPSVGAAWATSSAADTAPCPGSSG